MAKTYVLFNPHAGGCNGEAEAKKLDSILSEELVYINMTEIESYADFFSGITPENGLIICGGDGTLTRFARDTVGISYENEVRYFATGSGNDFYRDLENTSKGKPVVITDYLKNLPTVTVNGKTYPFLNGVGYGIDGYCCEKGDELRATTNKPINYTAIAIKGVLFHFKPRTATVSVDGKEYTFKRVWIAPVMHGRYYGGGMMMSPKQIRNNPEGTLTLGVFHNRGSIGTLITFPKIFTGEHVNTTAVTELVGKEFTVAFDRPTPLQIDGETIKDVTSYSVSAYSPAKLKATV